MEKLNTQSIYAGEIERVERKRRFKNSSKTMYIECAITILFIQVHKGLTEVLTGTSIFLRATDTNYETMIT